MCRLFGFRSVIKSQVHSSLLQADNALGTQSERHPDGWGVAYYVDDCPQLMRSPQHALADNLFHRLSGVAASETVLAHVRKATQGEKTMLNCHPFQHGRWTFAHNGDIPDFSRCREQLLELISADLRRFILGDTDSETIFFLLLSELRREGPLRGTFGIDKLVGAVRKTVRHVRSICDELGRPPCLLTLVLTDGQSLVAMQGGKELFYSTYKRQCPERHTCSSLSQECEAPTTTGYVNHLIVSSEPLQGDNVWEELSEGDIVAVDGEMKLSRDTLERVRLAIVADAVSPVSSADASSV